MNIPQEMAEKAQRQYILDIFKKYGLDIDGGVMIDHLYRFTENLEKAYWSPHHHIIYTGWINGNIVKQIYNDTGLIIKQISTCDTWQDVKQMANYLLTHSACYQKQENKRSSEHSVRYFGAMNNRKLKVESINKYSLDTIDTIDKQFGKIEAMQMIKGHGIKRIQFNKVKSDTIKGTAFSDHTTIEIKADLYKLYETRDKLKTYIEPKVYDKTTEQQLLRDNPAYTQSDHETKELDEYDKAKRDRVQEIWFNNSDTEPEPIATDTEHTEHTIDFEPYTAIQMIVEYYDIEQSVYHVFPFDFSDERLCVKCSRFLTHHCLSEHADHRRWQAILSELPDNVQLTVLDENQELQKPSWEYEGLPYITDESQQAYDQGLYEKPPVDEFNPHMQYRINRQYQYSKTKIELKEKLKRTPTPDEITTAIGQNDNILLNTIDGNIITQTQAKERRLFGEHYE